MKKIFTLLFFVMATLTAMAGTSFTVTNPMTIIDNTQSSMIVANQTVEVIQNDDETWSLKFESLASDNYTIGDITFDGVTVTDKGYYVYSLQCNDATGKVTDTTSPYVGKTLILQMAGELSPKGYGSQAFTFEIFCDEDEDIYFQGSFSPDEGMVDGIIVPVYYVGKSDKGACQGESNLGVINAEDGSVSFQIDGLTNVNNGEEYSTLTIDGLEMGFGDEEGVYVLQAENTTAITEEGTTVTVKKLDLELVSNALPAVGDDDDMGFGGDDDMGVGGDDDMGVGGDDEWSIIGTLVIADPTTGDEFTYELSNDPQILTAIKAAKAGANGAAEYFSVNGAKLQGAQKGLNIVRKDGKTIKCVVK